MMEELDQARRTRGIALMLVEWWFGE